MNADIAAAAARCSAAETEDSEPEDRRPRTGPRLHACSRGNGTPTKVLMSEVFGRHPSAAGRRTPNIGSEGQQQWVPRSARAYTAADHASVANAREHHANLVYEVVFPQPGALGLNLRSYFVQNSAGARLGLPEYGSLVVLDCQNAWLTTVVHSGDLLISINGEKLTGTNFSFAESISMCSRAPLPRVFRFARLGGDASSAEIELALTGDICAVFDAVDTPQKRLVTAQLHPSAPPFFYLNAPTRQPGHTSQ